MHTRMYICKKYRSRPQLSLPFLLILSLSITFLCQLQLISMTKEASCSHSSLTPGSGSSGKKQPPTYGQCDSPLPTMHYGCQHKSQRMTVSTSIEKHCCGIMGYSGVNTMVLRYIMVFTRYCNKQYMSLK